LQRSTMHGGLMPKVRIKDGDDACVGARRMGFKA
jgi:hypothetical protein